MLRIFCDRVTVPFSKTQEYAVQALIHLALTPTDFRLNRDVAEQLDVPGPYLAKVLVGNETVVDMAAKARKGRSRLAPPRKVAIKR